MNPTINEDGFSIKGCSYIYAPKGQAGEYSKLAANPYRGCGHGCAYCYVPLVLKMQRTVFDAGAVPRPDFITHLRKDAAKYQQANITEQVMLSFTTDPFHPGDNSLTRETIKIIQEHGMGICTLTKGGGRALRDIDLFRPNRDAFAATLTSLDPAFSLKWERNAALPVDRIATLRSFHDASIYTWVSLEPVLDTEATKEIIRETYQFVDLYKVGRVNYVGLTKTTNWERFAHEVIDLLNSLGAEHYIKKDLQPFLPKEYRNEKYRSQWRELPVLHNA